VIGNTTTPSSRVLQQLLLHAQGCYSSYYSILKDVTGATTPSSRVLQQLLLHAQGCYSSFYSILKGVTAVTTPSSKVLQQLLLQVTTPSSRVLQQLLLHPQGCYSSYYSMLRGVTAVTTSSSKVLQQLLLHPQGRYNTPIVRGSHIFQHFHPLWSNIGYSTLGLSSGALLYSNKCRYSTQLQQLHTLVHLPP
jgi:hypothetical protein